MKHLIISFIKGLSLTTLIAICVLAIGKFLIYFSQFGQKATIGALLAFVTILFTITFFYGYRR